MAKDWAIGFYGTTMWRRQRLAILKRDNFTCTERGCHRRATEVHHIIELNEKNVNDPNISMNPDNLRSLCRDCHQRITRQEKGGGGILQAIVFDDSGRPIPPGWG